GEVCIHTPAAMLGYDDEAKTREVLQLHEDGLKWLHTGDFGYMDENGVLYVYGRGETYRYGGGYLSEIFMENNIVDAEIPGLVDNFFVITEDPEHEGYFIPYLYVVLEDGYSVDDIRTQVCEALQEFEWPVEIIQIPERPFFHFKTNRIGLAKEIKSGKTGQSAVEEKITAEPVQPVKKTAQAASAPNCTLNEYLHRSYVKPTDAAMKYYGTDLSWEKVFCLVEQTVRGLRSMGFGKDDQIPVFLRSVPEFIILLLAAEKIGAALLSCDDLADMKAEIIRTSGKNIAIVHDFISQKEVNAMEEAGVETFICLSPYHFADRKQIPENIASEIQALYSEGKAHFAGKVLDWNAFIEAGDSFFGFDEVIEDTDRPLYCSVPAASESSAQPVVHSARSILGILTQILEVKPLTSSSDPFGA
ncbi:MAG: AMP-binding protein, partial [Clostridia bacterium]|nr:AMP-binding protein [Clostridia bacterium]